ncbi:N-6 DNA methylase [Acidithiobacillus sp.]|uniref:N-6 DNA methylase n=1 Tax=Acidithiobacillus sp. TaxID=1872118 RepID=UPI003459E178
MPPAKNGDYAFLLHILKSMKSSGKGAVILPHGVLFRGGSLRQSGCASAADGVRMEVNPGYKLTEVGVIPEDWRVGTIGQINCTNVCGTIRAISDDTFFLSRALAAVARNYVSRNLGNPELMNDIVKKVAVTMPSTLPEQHAIATALSDVGTLLTKLDQLIAKKRDIITGGNGNAGKKKCQTIRRARVRRGPRRG